MHLSLNDPPGVAYCRIFRKDNTSVQSEGMPVFAADEAGALQGRDEKVATKPQGIITVRKASILKRFVSLRTCALYHVTLYTLQLNFWLRR